MSAHNINLARRYAAAGVPIFPCREFGERTKSPYTVNGFHQASADSAVLKYWASAHPGALYGLPCGPNAIFALDADRHGNGDGVATIRALFAQQAFDGRSVPMVQTPRDGLHFIFQKPSGLAKTKSKIAEAVDVRDNGYIIAPGNVLPDGRCYVLASGTIERLASAIANRTLPQMPQWLIAAALQLHRAPTLFDKPFKSSAPETQLRGLVNAVIGAPTGNRNKMLFWVACRVGGLMRDGAVGEEFALALLLAAGQKTGLGEHEVRATAMSGLRQGHRDAARAC